MKILLIINAPFLLLIRLYRRFLSPLLGNNCRFHPSCSAYAEECFEKFPLWKAVAYSTWRIVRCNPLSQGYFDPVPEK